MCFCLRYYNEIPTHTFIFETITTHGFFENIYKLINFKVHNHHSHVTGKIVGYAHDICNMKVRENQVGFSCIAHNYLNFHFYFMLRDFRVSCWGEDINIGGNGLSSVNFSNMGRQMKIIDTMKYFQTSLAQTASTTTVEEKEKIKKIMLQVLVRHVYFGKVWSTLTANVREKLLDVLSSGKGMIPSEKIIVVNNSLDTKPEKDFFEESEFYSFLKQKFITKCDYETVKFKNEKFE